jgi:hypothetical protein
VPVWLTPLLGFLQPVLDKFFPDQTQKLQFQMQLQQLAAQQEGAQLDAQLKQALAAADIVKAEAQSASWLTSNWRPLTMLWLMMLITCHLFGLTDFVHVTETQYDLMWKLVELGLGGYVIGRSAEKTAGAVVTALKSKA